jgi:hypothetical protein
VHKPNTEINKSAPPCQNQSNKSRSIHRFDAIHRLSESLAFHYTHRSKEKRHSNFTPADTSGKKKDKYEQTITHQELTKPDPNKPIPLERTKLSDIANRKKRKKQQPQKNTHPINYPPRHSPKVQPVKQLIPLGQNRRKHGS